MAESDGDSSLDLHRPPRRKLRGLWGVMRETDDPPAKADEAAEGVEGAEDNAEEATVADGASGGEDSADVTSPESSTEATPFAAPGRGLWALMEGAEATGARDAETAAAERVEPTSESSDAAFSTGRGLWSVMQALTDTDDEPEAAQDDSRRHREANEPVDLGESESDLVDASPAPATATSAIPSAPSVASPALADIFTASTPARATGEIVRSRSALPAAAAGAVSLPLSLFALLDSFWWRLPATAAGFFGMAAGLAAWNEIARPRSRRTGKSLAVAGVVCGVLGMFLGPLVLSPLGAWYRESTGDRMTTRHLQEVGHGLDRFYEKESRYPAGARLGKDADGRERSLHGWMTALLPYLGEADLYRTIDVHQPWNAVENQPAMKRRVGTFEASGGDLTPIEGGFAPAHFSGLGGKSVAEGQGEVHLGIFDRGSDVRRDQIVDGLSNTLIVGEVAHRYPAWGDPENWRTIGTGLNRRAHGFGNAAGTGATFLKADGSVQFFSNKTSIEVLQRLSTRDGNDPLSELDE